MPDTAKLHTVIKVLVTRKQRAKSAAVYINCFNLNRDWSSRRPAISFQTKPAHFGLLHLHLLSRHQSFAELFYCSEGFETYLSDGFIVKAILKCIPQLQTVFTQTHIQHVFSRRGRPAAIRGNELNLHHLCGADDCWLI